MRPLDIEGDSAAVLTAALVAGQQHRDVTAAVLRAAYRLLCRTHVTPLLNDPGREDAAGATEAAAAYLNDIANAIDPDGRLRP